MNDSCWFSVEDSEADGWIMQGILVDMSQLLDLYWLPIWRQASEKEHWIKLRLIYSHFVEDSNSFELD